MVKFCGIHTINTVLYHFQCKMEKTFPLVNYFLKSYKHSAYYKLCCKDLKINRGEISHTNAHAKSKGHKNNAKSKKGQRTFTISSHLSLSKSLTLLKIHLIFHCAPMKSLNCPPTPPFFLGNSFLGIGFSWHPKE